MPRTQFQVPDGIKLQIWSSNNSYHSELQTNSGGSLLINTRGNNGDIFLTPNGSGFIIAGDLTEDYISGFTEGLSIGTATSDTRGGISIVGNKTGSDATCSFLEFHNSSAGAAGSASRLATIIAQRRGADNSGAIQFSTNNAGTFSTKWEILPAGSLQAIGDQTIQSDSGAITIQTNSDDNINLIPNGTGYVSVQRGTSGTVGIQLEMDQPGSNGTRDSHWLVIRGTAYDGSGHNADWKIFTDVTTNAGNSLLTFQNRIDAASYATTLTISESSVITSNNAQFNSLTASRFVKTDGSKILTSSSADTINLATEISGTLPVGNGGTGLSSCDQGDIIYSNASNTLTLLNKNTTATRYLSNTGTSNNPAWAQVNLSNGVTGTLPIDNGGTNNTSFNTNSIIFYNGSALSNDSIFTYDSTNDQLKINYSGGNSAFYRFHIVSNDALSDELYLENTTAGASLQLDGHASTSWRILADTSQNFQLAVKNGSTNYLKSSLNGNIIIGNEAAVATNATDGFLYIPTCAGNPSGTPTSYTGKVAIIFDTTNNELFVYDGSWISVALS